MTFGEKVKGLRRRYEISQQKLADILMVTKETIIRWERDDFAPHPLFQFAVEHFDEWIDRVYEASERGEETNSVEALKKLIKEKRHKGVIKRALVDEAVN